MKNKRLILIAAVFMTLVLAALPFLSACGGGGQTLKIGITTPTTGPAAEKGSPMGHANLDCFEYINSELGGIGGYQVEVVWLDNAYDAAKAVTVVKKLMDEGCLMFGTASSKIMSAVMETANRAEFPGIACFTSPVTICHWMS